MQHREHGAGAEIAENARAMNHSPKNNLESKGNFVSPSALGDFPVPPTSYLLLRTSNHSAPFSFIFLNSR